MEKISGIYKITNTITGDFYIGSSKNVKHRWRDHKRPSMRKKHPNNQMYLDMQKYGLDKFDFEILAEVEEDKLKEVEQQFIEALHPTYNSNRAKGHDSKRYKKYQMEYVKSHRESHRESHKKAQNKYDNQLCLYNSETLTLAALAQRFTKAGIDHPFIEAKKYLLNNNPIEFYDVYP